MVVELYEEEVYGEEFVILLEDGDGSLASLTNKGTFKQTCEVILNWRLDGGGLSSEGRKVIVSPQAAE